MHAWHEMGTVTLVFGTCMTFAKLGHETGHEVKLATLLAKTMGEVVYEKYLHGGVGTHI